MLHSSSLSVSLLLSLTIAAKAGAPYLETNGRVVIEAEHFEKRTAEPGGNHKYVIVPDEDPGQGGPFENVRGGKYVQNAPEEGQNKNADASVVGADPHLDYIVQINTTGEYQLYLRTLGYDGGADSLYVQIVEITSPGWYRYSPDPNGTDFAQLRNDNADANTAIGWNGYAAPEVNSGDGGEVPAVWTISKAGTYTIRISQREDSNAIDALILQLSSLPPPTDPGPTESPLAGTFVRIDTDPKDATAALNATATFTVVASGSSALTYQWQKAAPGSSTFADISGATSASLTTASLTTADNGVKYRVNVSITGKSLTSREAVLTVDTVPPTIASAAGSGNFLTATVVFAEAVTSATAGDKANYSVDGGLAISAVKVVNPTTVRLTTSKQTSGTKYTVTMNNIKDLVGNTMAANTKATFTGFVLGRGALTFETYLSITGNAVDNLTSDPKYPDSPDDSAFVGAFDSRLFYPNDSHEGYGGRMSGWLIPAETAQYELFIRSDDASQLFLSSDDKPSNAAVVAEETGCCGAFEETGAAETSAPISLTAGKRYYIQALWKEGTGGDFCQVAWRKVGDATAAGSLTPIPGKFFETYLNPDVASLDITKQPQSVTVTANTRTTLSIAAVGKSILGTTVNYQWQKNGADIPGATKDTYISPILTLADNGTKFACVVSVPTLSKTSSEATVTVVNDTVKPTLVSARTYGQSSQVTVVFSEPVSAASVGTAKFTIDGGVSATKATQANSPDTVRLATSAIAGGKAYTLTVSGIKDLAGNEIAADSKIALDLELHYAGTVLADKPVLYLQFEEADVAAAENIGSLGAAANGKYMPNPQLGSPGPRPPAVPGFDDNNRAASFNGTTDFVTIENQLLQERKAFSIELWIKPDPFSNTRVGLAGQNDAVEFGFIDPSTIQIWTPSGGSLNTGYRFPRGEWHHIVTVGSGTNLRTYFDGKLAGTGGSAVADNYGSSTFNVNIGGGGVFDGSGNFFTGQIDEVAIYDFALSDARVLAHYNAGATSTAQPSVAITSPTEGATLPAGVDATITVSASAAAGKTISKVEFFSGTTKLGEATSSPYTLTVPKVPEGRYTISARATDSAGLFKDSTPVNVVVGTPKPQVLFLIGTDSVPTLNASDAGVRAKLQAQGFEVKVVNAPTSVPDDANNTVLIVTSSTVNSGDVGDKFRITPVPVLDWEQALQDNYLMTVDSGNDHGTLAGQTDLNIVKVDHPLAGGLTTGVKTVITTGQEFSWGVPNANAVVIATIADDPTHAVIYGYEKGAKLIDGTPAPARRVMFFMGNNGYSALTADGMKLFDAALAWALGGGATTGERPKFAAPALQGGNLVLTWTGAGTLQSADSVVGPWADVANAKSPFTAARSGNAKFYRVKQ